MIPKGVMIINNAVYGSIYDNENDILACIDAAMTRCSYASGEPDIYEIIDNLTDVIYERSDSGIYYFRGTPINKACIEDMLEIILDSFNISYIGYDGTLRNSCQQILFEEWF